MPNGNVLLGISILYIYIILYKMNKLKYDTIILEGIDKTGKDTLIKYLASLGEYKYAIYQRGVISNNVYNNIYNRPMYEYNINKHALYVLLEADYDDLKIRFKINNEPNIDIPLHLEKFSEIFYEMTEGCPRVTYNTSKMTPIDIAKDIIETIENLNNA